ncbi:2-amino-4-hydroxy-6-hydroxymethyldihydropteridine diphosphokinase [Fluoribacter dumoffii]|uniref:2-amino-4-hydroxy-6-hydroxymethyldihydropteridine pyrophosphokinase n=1 Tax=Fluoribacter dumoffii TaxID=463 RepID=A0A377G9R3_9GAMM|nr:2-amino-4-hydroxy-6-hydroxymethyldihydropteridine diphosphokinase [Fluoribacter dumoffii]KTC90249.1 2-amino-4-hydroxy-6- hydroxymethyldihydropteridine pyrophosphokinase [Fluoribacter dumoffii NY 23]MCW8385567.1 2-amino-4-hydroxy-6-hydroxymethyldihydropteridine diphosphokinase [Fluoribacter dumoffii]MCW8418594.1 2-amino-4-hydroxy-6-hydroxymethyldihydropteridine diphosphokinase [Fluoribacter dumoffii]MCW8453562.1 2-amino-4-hydroxy-6-hydroxymethyldihydropteridine diphosphokinase [Fluoribacter d
MNVCYLGLGSNQQMPERQLRQAIKSIKALRHTVVTKVSSFYWTKAWGLQGQQDFCNAVIELITYLSPLQLLNACQKIEKQQGRVRKKRWGPRIIDIDLLFYENRVIRSKKLTLPHPHIQARDFVLNPLMEINPNYKIKDSTGFNSDFQLDEQCISI